MAHLQKINTCLWCNNNAEEMVTFYTSIFPDSRVGQVTRYGKDSPMPEGTVLTIAFTLAGQDFIALNGGPQFSYSEAVSLVVNCADQAEIDHYWDALLAGGGNEVQCGWLKDKFGLSWQIVPVPFLAMIADMSTPGAQRAMAAMMEMVKLDLPALQKAYAGT